MSFGKSKPSVKKLEHAFADADELRQGCLDAEGILMAMLATGIRATTSVDRVRTLLPRFDGNGDGLMTLGEARKLQAYLQKGHNVVDEIDDIYLINALLRNENAALKTGKPQPIKEPSASIRIWLEHVKAGFGRFASAFKDVGIEDVDDLIEANDQEVEHAGARLLSMGAKELQQRRVMEAVQRARQAVLAPASSTRTVVHPQDTTSAPPPAPPPPPKPLLTHALTSPTREMQASPPVVVSEAPAPASTTRSSWTLTAVRPRSGKRSSSAKHIGGVQQAPAECHASVREWLDEVKGGYGSKFAVAFEGLGIEHQADIANIDERLAALVFEKLRTMCGARELHASVLRRALAGAGAELSMSGPDPKRAAAGGHAETRQQRALTTGKRFAAFISHHKRDAAMEARWVSCYLTIRGHVTTLYPSSARPTRRRLTCR